MHENAKMVMKSFLIAASIIGHEIDGPLLETVSTNTTSPLFCSLIKHSVLFGEKRSVLVDEKQKTS